MLINLQNITIAIFSGCFVESEAKGPAIHKYRSLLEKSNTPFSPCLSSAAPARRLWNYLVRIELVQDIFIRAVFGKKKPSPHLTDNTIGSITNSANDSGTPIANESAVVAGGQTQLQNIPEPVRIIHKDQEQISAFCLNLVNPGLLALATPREVQEMDISLLLESPNWMEDECEMDIMNLTKDIETIPSSNFLVIQTSTDKYVPFLPWYFLDITNTLLNFQTFSQHKYQRRTKLWCSI